MTTNKEIVKNIKKSIAYEMDWLLMRNIEFKTKPNYIRINVKHIYMRDVRKMHKLAKKHLTKQHKLDIHAWTMENSLKWVG